ncbi:MAG: uncharacterized protein K0S27_579 [Gammaproteobacteria bacterium]|jgi:hypothetical protein|nr:uncharacterized protein [Gammaproteobacteria bacterium]
MWLLAKLLADFIIDLTIYRSVIIIFLAFFIQNCFALQQNTKQWLGFSTQQSFGRNNQWRSFIFSQLRFIDQSHLWQAVLLESGLGYKLAADKSMWLGYRWTGRDPYNGFFYENRLFQQLIWDKKLTPFSLFVFRSRLEEITRSRTNSVSLRFRQRFAVEIRHALFENAFPFLYDEVFFQLNHPSYETQSFIAENRLFLGFNLFFTKKTWWEIGYINQYQIKTPQQTQNQMSHILSCTYNFN